MKSLNKELKTSHKGLEYSNMAILSANLALKISYKGFIRLNKQQKGIDKRLMGLNE